MTTFIHSPDNNGLHIDSVWLVISSDETGEGVCAAPVGGMMVPLMAADETRLKGILPIARKLAAESRRPLKLIKLTTREEILDILPHEGLS